MIQFTKLLCDNLYNQRWTSKQSLFNSSYFYKCNFSYDDLSYFVVIQKLLCHKIWNFQQIFMIVFKHTDIFKIICKNIVTNFVYVWNFRFSTANFNKNAEYSTNAFKKENITDSYIGNSMYLCNQICMYLIYPGYIIKLT